MIVKIIFDNLSCEFVPPIEMLPKGRSTFYDHHFQSTPYDNLIEFCGRVCYDSTKSENTRNSLKYHKHINEVNHGSVQEHCNLTFEVKHKGVWSKETLLSVINRPGTFVSYYNEYNDIRISINIRAINEWYKQFQNYTDIIGNNIIALASLKCPLALENHDESYDNFYCEVELVKPTYDEEIFVSFFISDVSRNLTHELVRHKWRTAVSQRSTRYVDESESKYIWHPLLEKYKKQINDLGLDLDSIRNINSEYYKKIKEKLEEEIVSNIFEIDRLTARKQARGAARGILSSCLSTELVFTASIAQWKRMILQRCNNAADAEIRLLMSNIFDELVTKKFIDKDNFVITNAIDGFGYHIKERKEV